jgi:hypothetical protein
MRVQELLPLGLKAGRRMRRALPKTIDAIQTRVERIGSGVVERVRSSRAVAAAGRAVVRGSERSVVWVRENPRAAALTGLGGVLGTLLLLRARRNARRQPRLLRMLAAAPQLRRGMGTAFGRFLAWALTPRKPLVFRAVMIKW